MELIFVGIITAVNFIFIKFKIDKKRYEDAIIDIALFVTILSLFSGSYSGMVVGMVASMIISIYLYKNPPTYFKKRAKTNPVLKRVWAAAKNLDPDGPYSKKYDKLDDL